MARKQGWFAVGVVGAVFLGTTTLSRAEIAFQAGTDSVNPAKAKLSDLEMYTGMVNAVQDTPNMRVVVNNETPDAGAKALFTPTSKGGRILYDSTPSAKTYDVFIELVHELRHTLDHIKGRISLVNASADAKIQAETLAFAIQAAFVRILLDRGHKALISDKYYTSFYDPKAGFTAKAFAPGGYMFATMSSYYRRYVNNNATDSDVEKYLGGKAIWVASAVNVHNEAYLKYKEPPVVERAGVISKIVQNDRDVRRDTVIVEVDVADAPATLKRCSLKNAPSVTFAMTPVSGTTFQGTRSEIVADFSDRKVVCTTAK